MSESFFRRVVVPVANREDATASAVALAPYVEAADATVFAVHVIEKAGGAPDKASVEQRECHAKEIFADFIQNFADVEANLETRILYGTNIAETIVEAAHDFDAIAIVFTPRGGGRWVKLLTGDVTIGLVTDSDVPVIVLPDHEVAEE